MEVWIKVLAEKFGVPESYLSVDDGPPRSENCCDCGANVLDLGEYAFMLKPDIWQESGAERFCCVGCLEARLQRKLCPTDFNHNVPLTQWHWCQSTRLKSRILGT